MTDRELLELAAKAAGVERGWWNPLTDDGEAFLLAVKLRIGVSHSECECCVWAYPMDADGVPLGDGDGICERLHEAGGDVELQDRATATRRAIVRAAAAIGSVS